MRHRLLASVAALCVAAGAARADGADPFRWLEQVHSARALAWVAQQDAHTQAVLESDPRYAAFHATALTLFEAQDRLPRAVFRRPDTIDDVWQDAAHPHGLWRTTTLAAFRTGTPAWHTLLDLDALSAAAHANYFSKGEDCLPPAATRCLVSLSDGGGDAISVREFDAAAGRFVAGGFALGAEKQVADWIDADTLIAARDWSGHGADISRSGMPIELRALKRGGDPAHAEVLFRGDRGDAEVDAAVLRDPAGHMRAIVAVRQITYLDSEYSLIRPGQAPLRLALPRKSNLQGLVDGQLVVSLGEDWRGFRSGSIVSLPARRPRADRRRGTRARLRARTARGDRRPAGWRRDDHGPPRAGERARRCRGRRGELRVPRRTLECHPPAPPRRPDAAPSSRRTRPATGR